MDVSPNTHPQTQETPNNPPQLSLPINVRVMGWASLLNDVASEAIYPLLPSFLLSLGGSRTLLGLLEGISDSIASILKLAIGHASDRAGRRKPFIVFGYVLACLSRPLLAFASSVNHVLIIRVADRIGKGFRTAPRDALIAESTDASQHGRAFGYHRSMDHLGAAIGPLLAALFLWLLPGQLRLLMFVCILPGVIVIFIQCRYLREQPASRYKPNEKESEVEIVALQNVNQKGTFKLFLFSILIFAFANSTDAFLLIRAQESGVALPMLPLLWGFFHILKSYFNRWIGRLADQVEPKRLLMLGWLLYAIVYVGFGFSNAAWQIWILFVLYAFFYGLTEPSEKKIVAQFARSGRAGIAFGWFHTVIAIANLPASVLFGWLYQRHGAWVAFLFGSLVALTATFLLWFVRIRSLDRNSLHDKG